MPVRPNGSWVGADRTNGGGKNGKCYSPSVSPVRRRRGCRIDRALGGRAGYRIRRGGPTAGEVRPTAAVTRKRARGGDQRRAVLVHPGTDFTQASPAIAAHPVVGVRRRVRTRRPGRFVRK